jgi:hypothetical protein
MANRVFTNPNNYIDLSSYLISSLPFNKNIYSFPSDPKIRIFLGSYFDRNTSSVGEKPDMVTNALSFLYIPGTDIAVELRERR